MAHGSRRVNHGCTRSSTYARFGADVLYADLFSEVTGQTTKRNQEAIELGALEDMCDVSAALDGLSRIAFVKVMKSMYADIS